MRKPAVLNCSTGYETIAYEFVTAIAMNLLYVLLGCLICGAGPLAHAVDTRSQHHYGWYRELIHAW